jgi:hypothetical protein
MAHGNDRPDRLAAEAALLELVADGRAERQALGDDSLWTTARRTEGRPLAAADASSSV